MIRLLVEVDSFNYFYATRAQLEAWVKRHGYTLLGPSEARPQVTLWTAHGKPLLRVQELRLLTSTAPETADD